MGKTDSPHSIPHDTSNYKCDIGILKESAGWIGTCHNLIGGTREKWRSRGPKPLFWRSRPRRDRAQPHGTVREAHLFNQCLLGLGIPQCIKKKPALVEHTL